MNMLTNKVQFGLLSEEEQELFRNTGKESLQVWSGGSSKWVDCIADSWYQSNSVYRLAPKEEEWYRADDYLIQIEEVKEHGIQYRSYPGRGDHFCGYKAYNSLWTNFRPATLEEVKAVKPKETYVDLPIEWIDHHHSVKHEGSSHYLKGLGIGDYVSHSGYLSGFVFEGDCIVRRAPIKFTGDKKKLLAKATHARFVKGE
jgi:hypothetical protein